MARVVALSARLGTCGQVARRLHISSRNVAVRLHRAHKLLRPRLLHRIAGAEAIRTTKKNL